MVGKFTCGDELDGRMTALLLGVVSDPLGDGVVVVVAPEVGVVEVNSSGVLPSG